jgi:hypothetical protein
VVTTDNHTHTRYLQKKVCTFCIVMYSRRRFRMSLLCATQTQLESDSDLLGFPVSRSPAWCSGAHMPFSNPCRTQIQTCCLFMCHTSRFPASKVCTLAPFQARPLLRTRLRVTCQTYVPVSCIKKPPKTSDAQVQSATHGLTE